MSATAVHHLGQCVLPQVRLATLVVIIVFVLCIVALGYDPRLAIGGVIVMITGTLQLLRH